MEAESGMTSGGKFTGILLEIDVGELAGTPNEEGEEDDEEADEEDGERIEEMV